MERCLMRTLSIAIAVAMSLMAAAAAESAAHAKISTSKGDIIVELDPVKAPKTVVNFLQYAGEGHYDRTLFHRIARGFVIQGGGYSRLFTERPTREPVPYEGANGLKNLRGTIAMARLDDPNSATAQWYINLKNNPKLDHLVDQYGTRYGYTVFGKVIAGMDVVDAIGAVETGPGGPFDEEVPLEPIFIERVDPTPWPLAE
jgi:cyclophilin family peptidyl-prolyl cis-trans isomerase